MREDKIPAPDGGPDVTGGMPDVWGTMFPPFTMKWGMLGFGMMDAWLKDGV